MKTFPLKKRQCYIVDGARCTQFDGRITHINYHFIPFYSTVILQLRAYLWEKTSIGIIQDVYLYENRKIYPVAIFALKSVSIKVWEKVLHPTISKLVNISELKVTPDRRHDNRYTIKFRARGKVPVRSRA